MLQYFIDEKTHRSFLIKSNPYVRTVIIVTQSTLCTDESPNHCLSRQRIKNKIQTVLGFRFPLSWYKSFLHTQNPFSAKRRFRTNWLLIHSLRSPTWRRSLLFVLSQPLLSWGMRRLNSQLFCQQNLQCQRQKTRTAATAKMNAKTFGTVNFHSMQG